MKPLISNLKLEILTGDGTADLPGGLFAGFHRGLLAVPGCVWGTDQVGGILQWTCGKTVQEGKGGYTGQ